MPELPEVETVRRTLLPHVVGQRVLDVMVHQPSLRWLVDVTELKARVANRCVEGIRRRAKYLLFDLEGDSVMAVHLGMSGQLSRMPAHTAPRLHDHAVFALADGFQLRFNDARRFGSIDVFDKAREASHARLVHLGVEPLDAAVFDGPALYAMSRKVAKPIKNFLMDAQRIVGVGNIYACEALFAAGIHPQLPAHRLSRPRAERLAQSVVQTLVAAIGQGGTTLRDFVDGQGQAGYFKVHLHVYGREGQSCTTCTRPIRRVVQAGRSTFYCVGCQKR
jgi:formamidopyrimidine-DNA glycosylase